jgi:hypothetical protein
MAEQGTGTYLHALDGRIRVKSALVKRTPHKAAALEQQLRAHPGVTEVTVRYAATRATTDLRSSPGSQLLSRSNDDAHSDVTSAKNRR